MNEYEKAINEGMPEDQAQALYPSDYQVYQQSQSEVAVATQPSEQEVSYEVPVVGEGVSGVEVIETTGLTEAQKAGLAKVAAGEGGTLTEQQIQESLTAPAFEGTPITTEGVISTPTIATQLAEISQYYDPQYASVNDPASEAHAIELYLKLQNQKAVEDALIAEGVIGSVANNLAAHASGNVSGDTVNYLFFNPVTGEVEKKEFSEVLEEAKLIAQIKEVEAQIPELLEQTEALTAEKIKVLYPSGYEDVSLQEAYKRLSPEDAQKVNELESQYYVLAIIYSQMIDWKNQADIWYGQTFRGFEQMNILQGQPENLVPYPSNYAQLQAMNELAPYFDATYNNIKGVQLSLDIVDAIEAKKQGQLLTIGISQETIDTIGKSLADYKKEFEDYQREVAAHLAIAEAQNEALNKFAPYKTERGRVVKVIIQNGTVMPEVIDLATGKLMTPEKWNSLTWQEQQELSKDLVLEPSVSYDLYKYFKDNGTGQDAITTAREAGFDNQTIDDIVKAVKLGDEITSKAIPEIDKMLSNGMPYGAGEMSLDRAIEQSGYKTLLKYDKDASGKIIGYSEYDYNTGKLVATYRWLGLDLIAVDPETGKPTVGSKDVMLAKWNLMTTEQKEKASLLYAGDPYNKSLFGEIYVELENLVAEVSQKGFIPYLLTGFVGLVPTAMKPIAKTITDQPTTVQEWALGGACIVLLGLPVSAPALSATFGRVGVIATGTLLAGAGGVFIKQTVDDWEIMTPSQRALAVAMDALIFAGAGLTFKGLKVSGDYMAKNAGEVVSVASKPVGTEVSIPVKIGETISVIKTTIADIPNRVLTVPEAIRYYAEGLGMKAEQIALAIERGFIEVTPEIAKKFADSVINAGENIVNRIILTPEAIKYYAGDVGIEASKIVELWKKGLLEVPIEVAYKVTDAVNRGVDVTSAWVMTRPQAIVYYLGEVGLKVEQVVELARKGWLEVTPEIAWRIGESIKKAGGDIYNRILTEPEMFDYYTRELGLKAEQAMELLKKGLFKVTLEEAKKIAEQIKYAIDSVDKRVVTMPDWASYYAKELKLKTGDIIELAKNKAINSVDITLEQARQIVEKVKATGDKFTSIPDAIEYYMGELGIKAGKVGDAIKANLVEIYEAMKNKDRVTVIEKARELERLSAQLDDVKLGEQLKLRAQDLQRNVDDYLKMAESIPKEDIAKVSDAVEVTNKIAKQTLNELLAETRAIERRNITDISSEAMDTRLAKMGTREYKAFEVQPREGTMEVKPTNPEQLRLINEISKDNALLYELYNKGGEPYDILQVVNRITENMDKLAKLREEFNPIRSLTQALEARLKELGYSSDEIARMTEQQRLEIVANGIPPSESGIRQRPQVFPEESSTGRGGVATKVKIETKPMTPEELEKIMTEQATKPTEKTTTVTKATPSPEVPTTRLLPEIEGMPYYALVWENGQIVTKLIVPQTIVKGFIESKEATWTKRAERPKQSPLTEIQSKTGTSVEISQQTQTQLKTKPALAPAPTPSPQPMPQPEPQPMPQPQPQPTPQPIPIRIPETPIPTRLKPPPIPPPLPSEEASMPKQLKRIPPGTIEWRQGRKWVVLPPPYRDEDKMYLDNPLPGTYKFAVGKGSAYRTLQVLGGKPAQDADVDMGWAQIHISSKRGKDITMDFSGGKEAVESRWADERARLAEYEREAYAERPQRVTRERIPRLPRERFPITRQRGRIEEPIGVRPRQVYNRNNGVKEVRQENGVVLPSRYYLGRKLRDVNLEVKL